MLRLGVLCSRTWDAQQSLLASRTCSPALLSPFISVVHCSSMLFSNPIVAGVVVCSIDRDPRGTGLVLPLNACVWTKRYLSRVGKPSSAETSAPSRTFILGKDSSR